MKMLLSYYGSTQIRVLRVTIHKLIGRFNFLSGDKFEVNKKKNMFLFVEACSSCNVFEKCFVYFQDEAELQFL